MPVLSKDFKQAIEEIPVRDLQKLVMQAASKNQEFYDMINIHYVSGKQAEKEIFEEAKDKALGELQIQYTYICNLDSYMMFILFRIQIWIQLMYK